MSSTDELDAAILAAGDLRRLAAATGVPGWRLARRLLELLADPAAAARWPTHVARHRRLVEHRQSARAASSLVRHGR